MVTCSFPDRESLERARTRARSMGYTDQDIHLFMSEQTHARQFQRPPTATSRSGSRGWVNAGATAAVPSAGTMLTLPAIGIVAFGPLASIVAGAAVATVDAGVQGSLVRAGIAEDDARLYEQDVKDGWIVLGIQVRGESDARRFEDEWRAAGETVCN